MNNLQTIFIVIPISIFLILGSSVWSLSGVNQGNREMSKKNIIKPPQTKSVKSGKSSSFLPDNISLQSRKKVKAYCCENGSVEETRMSQGDIDRRKNCSDNHDHVKKTCGYCCYHKDGETTPVNHSGEKLKCTAGGRGKFVYDESQCKIYCCLKGRITQKTKKECIQNNGKPNGSKDAAEENCGWCCKLFRVVGVNSKSQCKDNFFKSSELNKAINQCRPINVDSRLKKVDPELIRKIKQSQVTTRDSSQASVEKITDSQVKVQQSLADQVGGLLSAGQVRPEPVYPARITSTNCPRMLGPDGASLTIEGHDFTNKDNGQVDITVSGQTYQCEVSYWSDTRVKCRVPVDINDAIGGQAAKKAIIWLKPAQDMSMPRYPNNSGDQYYYNGDEGPKATCMIEPQCDGVDFVLNAIEIKKTGPHLCEAKVWITQLCDGEWGESSYTIVRTNDGSFVDGAIPAGLQKIPFESDWQEVDCDGGDIFRGMAEVVPGENKTNNNICDVQIGKFNRSKRRCYDF